MNAPRRKNDGGRRTPRAGDVELRTHYARARRCDSDQQTAVRLKQRDTGSGCGHRPRLKRGCRRKRGKNQTVPLGAHVARGGLAGPGGLLDRSRRDWRAAIRRRHWRGGFRRRAGTLAAATARASFVLRRSRRREPRRTRAGDSEHQGEKAAEHDEANVRWKRCERKRLFRVEAQLGRISISCSDRHGA